LTKEQTIFLLALREAEDGAKGYEFGVKNARGTDLKEQALWAIGSIKKNDTRWQKFLIDKGSISFTIFFAYFGGPYGRGWVEHDKEVWIDNVNFFIKEIENEFARAN